MFRFSHLVYLSLSLFHQPTHSSLNYCVNQADPYTYGIDLGTTSLSSHQLQFITIGDWGVIACNDSTVCNVTIGSSQYLPTSSVEREIMEEYDKLSNQELQLILLESLDPDKNDSDYQKIKTHLDEMKLLLKEKKTYHYIGNISDNDNILEDRVILKDPNPNYYYVSQYGITMN